MIKSPIVTYLLAGLVSFTAGAFLTTKLSEPAIAHAQDALDDASKTIALQKQVYDELKARYDFDETALNVLRAQLATAKGDLGAQALAQTGHVMTEPQCKAWMGVFPAVQQSAGQNVATVLYESGKTTVHLSLLPLPGAPRINITPNSQMAPKWIIPGKIQPQLVGGTRNAAYYWYDAQTTQWSGPFAPEHVVQ